MKRVAPPRPRGHFAAGLAGLVAAAFLLGGCPGEIDPAITPKTTGSGGSGGGGTCDATPIFAAKSCSAAQICHDSKGSAAGLDMASPGWETRLVGMIPAGGGSLASLCGAGAGPYLMANVQPAQGLFIQKLVAPPPCGDQMPQQGLGGYLTQTELNCVQKWANTLVMNAGSGGGNADGGTD